jgi:hypothetical protein
LLLECKREFPFNDALRILEVMWATLPIDNEPPLLSEISISTTSSEISITDILQPIPCRPRQRRALSCPQLSIIDERYPRKNRHCSLVTPYNEQLPSTIQQSCNSIFDNDEHQVYTSRNNLSSTASTKSREKSFENSYSLSEISEFDSDNLSTCSSNNPKTANNISSYLSANSWLQRLPTNNTLWLEEENSFLLFLCISILTAHRDFLLKQKNIDESEISMHFDRYRRRHNAERLLTRARTFYAQYIQWTRKKRMLDDLDSFSAS